MRRCYLVCYDIADDKRLRRVHKKMKAYGQPWQFSVFYCCLRDIDRVRLERDLREIINLAHDKILIIDLGANEDEARSAAVTIGPRVADEVGGTVVI